MTALTEWTAAEPDMKTVLGSIESPLDEIAAGNIPAVVLRGAWPGEKCSDLVQKLFDEELLYDPDKPIPAKFRKQSIPEGYYREGGNSVASQAWEERKAVGKNRIDIGSSLGYRGSDKEKFLDHSAETNELFSRLFSDGNDPVELIYDTLSQLSRSKRAVTAYEPDGRKYGAAIIRAHYGGYTYAPHFDSVRLREKRENYAVHQFDHQFAGVLVLQNSVLNGRTAQGIIHQYLWQPEIDEHLKKRTFPDYAAEHDVASAEISLEPGDLYFFNTRSIHEVPGVAGDLPRIVLATFIGYSSDQDEIFVWS